MSKKKGLAKLLLAAGVGVGIGILFAPKSGKETRADLKLKLDKLVADIKAIDKAEVRDELLRKVEEVKVAMADLDRAKATKMAKDAAANLKVKTEELAALAKDKATPVVQKLVEDARVATVKVSKEVINRLEEPKDKKTTE